MRIPGNPRVSSVNWLLLKVLQAGFEVFFLKWRGQCISCTPHCFFLSGEQETHTLITAQDLDAISPPMICRGQQQLVLFNHSLPVWKYVFIPFSILTRDQILLEISMSMMFGKVKTCNSPAAPDRSPAECNLVLLGVMGSGKSGPTLFTFI